MAPFIKEDKRHGSAIILLSPSYEVSNKLMNNNFLVDKMKLYSSYFIEKNIMYTINQESRVLELEHPGDKYITESGSIEQDQSFIESTDISIHDCNLQDCEINELYYRLGNKLQFFGEYFDEDKFDELYKSYLVNEATVKSLNSKYKKMLYNTRLRTNRDVISLYADVLKDNPWIKRTYPEYRRYKSFNLYVDLYYYNQSYLTHSNYTMIKSIDMYMEFLNRILHDDRLKNAGYTKTTVLLPVYGWSTNANTPVYDYYNNLNPISIIYKKLRLAPNDLKKFNGILFLIMGEKGYFKFDTAKVPDRFYPKFKRFIDILSSNTDFVEEDEQIPVNKQFSPDSITATIVNDIEKSTGSKINNLKTGATPKPQIQNEPEPKISPSVAKKLSVEKEAIKAVEDNVIANDQELTKKAIVKKVAKVAAQSTSVEDAYEKLDSDAELKKMLSDLEAEDDSGRMVISAARLNRITSTQSSFMKKQFEGKSIKDMLTNTNQSKELPEVSIPIDTINDEWHHVKAVNFEKTYDLDADIIKCIYSLSDPKTKDYPIAILNVKKEDRSTSEDSIYTYTVECEGHAGNRFSFKFDIPKFRDNRFMRLRGNEKIFSIEMPLIPISKTSDHESQLVSFYNKIFFERYNTSAGRSNPYSDKLIKALRKYKGKDIKVFYGNNTRICKKYQLPIDYIDLSSVFSKIVYYSQSQKENVTIYFNQDEIRKVPGVNPKNGIPIAMTESGKVVYYTIRAEVPMALFIANLIDNEAFNKSFEEETAIRRATYARTRILNTDIPVIVLLAHDLGLTKAMDIAGVKYDMTSKRRPYDMAYDFVQLKDGFIYYKITYDSMLFMNGLKDCTLEDISLTDINKKVTWVEQLGNFGGRQKSDGLDNFRALMMDPVTVEICKDYKLPTTYHEAIVYASNLLEDNKYIKHSDISGNRYRTNEVIAAQFYRILAQSYKDYANTSKRNRKAKLTMKQSAVIDLILEQNNTSDLSIFQPLSEIETKNSISTKGVSGLNEEHSYTLEKRGYDKSMENIIAQSTSFAGNVGINRQTTIDPGITGGRGYFKQSNIVDNNSVTQSMGMTEALSPFMLSSDDTYRNNMTFVQTAKHSTPVEDSDPLLVTTGADQAMPYLASNMFAFKAKNDGIVKEINPKYMIVEYKDKTRDYIDLSEQIKKNSDGGFYITLQLITNLKVNQRFKSGDILAWDKKSFNKKIGNNKLAYSMGHIAKIAVMTNEDGFEDSGVCSEWLAESMASDIVMQKSIDLPPNTNILKIVSIGDKIREGEPLMIFQNAFDEDDANEILKNLTIEDNNITEVGRIVINSSYTGDIADIKLYRTCEIFEMSTSLQKLFKNNDARIDKYRRIAKDSLSDVYFDPTTKVEPIGKMKKSSGVLIEFYVRYHDKLSIGETLFAA